jgi:hypothetical protein
LTKGSTPGVGVIKVTDGGKGREIVGLPRISNMKEGKETADTHGIAVRKYSRKKALQRDGTAPTLACWCSLIHPQYNRA